ncbi:lysozyme inhibitor LprI family protein [Clostridium perfringens]|uniref:lysozyme inhibitor LprI family protein n=1 Tax=Clostridium perfringens TaxID=1502 RepID=UPI0030D53910
MKKRNYLISLLAVVLSLGVLVGCGDKTNTSNEGASVNSSENSDSVSSKDSADVAKDKGEADKAQAKEYDSKVKEARNKDDSEKKEENSNNDSTTKEKETSKVDNSNSKESKGASNSSKNDESKSTSSKKENTKAESSLSKAKSEYLQKMKKIDSESKKLDKEYDSDRGSTQAGMNGISGEQAKLYDDELNQIYDYLKQNLSKEKAKELEKSEMAWIKEKESNIAEIKKQYEGGSVTPLMVNSEVAKESKERCYYLIDNYMN